jgi:hypothetical protein
MGDWIKSRTFAIGAVMCSITVVPDNEANTSDVRKTSVLSAPDDKRTR